MEMINNLEDICDVITKGTTPTSVGFNFVLNGTVNFIKIESIDKDGNILTDKIAKISEECNEFLKRSQLKEGDILFSIAGALGRVGIVTKNILPSNTNQALAIIRLKDKSNINIRYIKHILSSEYVQNQVSNSKGGVAQQNLSLAQIKKFQIPEYSLDKKLAIVEKLDKAFELIDQAKANIEQNIINAKELFQSKLDEVFSQKGDGWIEMSLGELGKVSMCKRILKNQTSPEGDIPFYKIGTFGKKPDAYISKELFDEYSSKYSYPNKGQILLSASGTIGRTVVFDGKPSFFQDSNIVWIDNKEEKVLNSYLFHFYKVCNWNPSKGATISRLYNDDLKRIKISFPDIEGQKILIPIMENLEVKTKSLLTKYENKLSNLEELRKSILEKAFKGELTH